MLSSIEHVIVLSWKQDTHATCFFSVSSFSLTKLNVDTGPHRNTSLDYRLWFLKILFILSNTSLFV